MIVTPDDARACNACRLVGEHLVELGVLIAGSDAARPCGNAGGFAPSDARDRAPSLGSLALSWRPPPSPLPRRMGLPFRPRPWSPPLPPPLARPCRPTTRAPIGPCWCTLADGLVAAFRAPDTRAALIALDTLRVLVGDAAPGLAVLAPFGALGRLDVRLHLDAAQLLGDAQVEAVEVAVDLGDVQAAELAVEVAAVDVAKLAAVGAPAPVLIILDAAQLLGAMVAELDACGLAPARCARAPGGDLDAGLVEHIPEGVPLPPAPARVAHVGRPRDPAPVDGHLDAGIAAQRRELLLGAVAEGPQAGVTGRAALGRALGSDREPGARGGILGAPAGADGADALTASRRKRASARWTTSAIPAKRWPSSKAILTILSRARRGGGAGAGSPRCAPVLTVRSGAAGRRIRAAPSCERPRSGGSLVAAPIRAKEQTTPRKAPQKSSRPR